MGLSCFSDEFRKKNLKERQFKSSSLDDLNLNTISQVPIFSVFSEPQQIIALNYWVGNLIAIQSPWVFPTIGLDIGETNWLLSVSCSWFDGTISEFGDIPIIRVLASSGDFLTLKSWSFFRNVSSVIRRASAHLWKSRMCSKMPLRTDECLGDLCKGVGS
jgi:hypothetical protein